MSNRTRKNNKGADRIRKMESKNSPEIPDRGETSEESGLPSGTLNWGLYESISGKYSKHLNQNTREVKYENFLIWTRQNNVQMCFDLFSWTLADISVFTCIPTHIEISIRSLYFCQGKSLQLPLADYWVHTNVSWEMSCGPKSHLGQEICFLWSSNNSVPLVTTTAWKDPWV